MEMRFFGSIPVNKNLKKISLAAVLIALNLASRAMLQFLPNIKPVTAILILTSIFMGITLATLVNIGTVLISGVLFGMGTFIPFQFIAWELIIIVSYLFKNVLKKNKVIFVIYAIISGLVFGFIVSLDMLIIYGIGTFIPYYLNGLIFDLCHALGNAAFSFILFIVYKRLENNEFFKGLK